MSLGGRQGVGKNSSFWRLRGEVTSLPFCSFRKLLHSWAHEPFLESLQPPVLIVTSPLASSEGNLPQISLCLPVIRMLSQIIQDPLPISRSSSQTHLQSPLLPAKVTFPGPRERTQISSEPLFRLPQGYTDRTWPCMGSCESMGREVPRRAPWFPS